MKLTVPKIKAIAAQYAALKNRVETIWGTYRLVAVDCYSKRPLSWAVLVNSFEIDGDWIEVNVHGGDSAGTAMIPLEYLTLTNAELLEKVQQEKQNRAEQEKAERIKANEAKKEKDIAELKRLMKEYPEVL